MKSRMTSPILIPALALLLLAAAIAVGYQVVSAQDSPGSVGDDPPAAPTGLTATHEGVGVMLEWHDPDDDSIVGYRVWRRYHRDSHEDAERPPVDDELQLHVAHTGSAENHFHDSDFVEHETVYGYAVAAIGSDGTEGATVTTPDAPGQAPDEIEGVVLEVVEGDVKITWSSLNDDTITDFHISRTSEDDPDGGNWIHLTNSHHSTVEYIDHHGLEPDKTYVYTISAEASHDASGHKVVITWGTHSADEGVTDWVIPAGTRTAASASEAEKTTC